MKPVNTKSLVNFLFDQMEKLDNKEIKVSEAKEQANLAKQVNSLYRYEINRAKVQLKIDEQKRLFGSTVRIREIDAAFDE